MDERQQQIKSGAGLEESRINEDFKEFLEKWGFWLLLAVAVAFGSMWLYQKYEQRRIAKIDSAFAAYESASGSANPSPDSLVRVADEYEGIRGVSDLARLRSADIFLHAARTGLSPGAEYTPEGELMSEDDLLDDERIARFLDQAQGLYAKVLESGRKSGSVLAIDGAFGLGAVAESKGDAEAARRAYAAASELAKEHGRPILARVADERLAVISQGVPAKITLYSEADLPELPQYTPPAPAPVETQIPVVDDGGLDAPLPEGDASDTEPSAPEAPEGDEDAAGDDAP